eukprot:TRINITY_DN7176_c0_g1_i1.p1 TRINITY_DN7176_c0_g1~~TRINITY_DN7176_c0_g1_i1.p1  ORF type:complete len:490 (+),score=103.94 TRINITY_DN7176_c0_g1_i1:231-1700(+)
MDDEEVYAPLDEVETRVYLRRFLVLGSYMICSLALNLAMFTFNPIIEVVEEWYGVSSLQVDLLTMVFLISGFSFRFPAMWIMDYAGLGKAIWFAAGCSCLGFWIRFLGSGPDGYWLVLAGQSVIAVGQAFVDIAPPKIAGRWFPPNERTTATAVGLSPLYFALLIGYVSTTAVVGEGEDLFLYLLVTAIASSVALVLIVLFFRGRPPMPPSMSAAARPFPFFQGIVKVFSNINFLYLFAVFVTAGGIAFTFSALITQLVQPNYSSHQAAKFVVVWVFFALLGAVAVGPVIDRKLASYRACALTCMVANLVAVLSFVLSMQFLPSELWGVSSTWVIYMIMALLGLSGAAIPAVIEGTIEASYPVPEATVMGVLFFGMNVSAMLFILYMNWLIKIWGSPTLANWSVFFGILIGAGCLVLYKEENNRQKFEEEHKEHPHYHSPNETSLPSNDNTRISFDNSAIPVNVSPGDARYDSPSERSPMIITNSNDGM